MVKRTLADCDDLRLLKIEGLLLRIKGLDDSNSETLLQFAYMISGQHGPPPDDYDLDPGKAVMTRILGSLAVPTESGAALVSSEVLTEALNVFWIDGSSSLSW
jgi:hypothetical protein